MVNIVSFDIDEKEYVNSGNSNATVHYRYTVIISSAQDGQTIQVTTSNQNGIIMTGQDTHSQPISAITTKIQGTFNMIFSILDGNQFPLSITQNIVLFYPDPLPSRPFRTSTLGKLFTINFSGTQPTEDKPSLGDIVTEFDDTNTFFLRDGTLAGAIKAIKTNSFPPSATFETFTLIAQTKDSNGQVVDLSNFPFTFGNSNEYSTPFIVLGLGNQATVTLRVWQETLAISQPNTRTFTDDTLPPPPTDKIFTIEATAQDGFTIGGNVDEVDLFLLQDNQFGVTSVNGTMIVIGESTLPKNTTYQTILDFLILHQIIIPPPPPPVGECPTGYHKQNLNCIADDQNNPPPDAIFCITCNVWILGTETCAVCEPPPTGGSNVCFTLLYTDLTETSHTLTSSDFDSLILDPVSTGICAPVVKNITDCNNTPQDLGSVRAEIFNKVAECLSEKEDQVDTSMVTISPMNFIITNEDRTTGSVTLLASDSFNPFWYNKPITLFTQIKNSFGAILVIRENNLNFTATERDEIIGIDESAFLQNELVIEFFVQSATDKSKIFATPKQITVTKSGSDDTTPKIESSFIKAMKGLLFGSIALTLLGDRDKGKYG